MAGLKLDAEVLKYSKIFFGRLIEEETIVRNRSSGWRCCPWSQLTPTKRKIKPKIIAVSEGDNGLEKKKKQAKEIGAKVIKVSKLIPHQSTSLIIDKIKI